MKSRVFFYYSVVVSVSVSLFVISQLCLVLFSGTLERVLCWKGVIWRTEYFSIVCCINVMVVKPIIVVSFCLVAYKPVSQSCAENWNIMAPLDNHTWFINSWPQQKLPKFGFGSQTTALWPMYQSCILYAKFDCPVDPAPECFNCVIVKLAYNLYVSARTKFQKTN